MNSSATWGWIPESIHHDSRAREDSEVVIKFAQNHVVFSPKDTGWGPPVI